MKKYFIYLVSIFLMAALFSSVIMPSGIHAEADFSFTGNGSLDIASVNFDEISGPDQTINITIVFSKLSGNKIIENVRIQDLNFNFEDSATQSETLVHKVTNSEYQDNRMIFEVTWDESIPSDENPDPSQTPVVEGKSGTLVLNFTPKTQEIELTREVSSRVVQKDKTIAIEYSIYNRSDRKISVTLSDPQIFSGTINLEVAAKERYDYSLEGGKKITANILSEPIATYTDSNENIQNIYADPKTLSIEIGNPLLNITIAANVTKVKYGESVKIDYTIQNTGNVEFKDVCIYDTLGYELVRIDSLPARSAKQKRSITTSALTTKRSFKFKVTGTEKLTNSKLEYYSNEETVDIEASDSDVLLSIKAESDKIELNEAGDVVFTITVTNNSNFDVNNIAVYLQNDNTQIGTIDTIPKGEAKSIQYTGNVTETTSFSFEAKTNDTAGTERTFVNDVPIWITLNSIIDNTNTPGQTTKPTSTKNNSVKNNTNNNIFFNSLLYILVVLIVLLLVSGITYIILYFSERKYKKKNRIILNNTKLR